MKTLADQGRVGYVVKRYPRFSETFIVNEILEHEAAGLSVEIFALRPVRETHFQDLLAKVRAPVSYLQERAGKPGEFWQTLRAARDALPGFWRKVDELGDVDVNDLSQAMELALRARQAGIGHLHAHFGTIAATVTRLAAKLGDLTYSVTVHAKDIYHQSVDEPALAAKLRDASAVVTVSDYNACHLTRRFALPAGHVRRIYNGLDLNRFEYRSPPQSSNSILAVGRLVEKKGFDVLIAACAVLRERDIDFNCSIIGDGDLKSRLLDAVRRHGLDDHVTLLGSRAQSELIAHFREAAVMAAPCVVGGDGDRDGLPTVLLEAMALGTPCVSTSVTGIPELVRHDETGLCLQPNDAPALADALERLLGDAALRDRLSVSARLLIEQEFDARRNAERLRQLFQRRAQPVSRMAGGVA